MIAQAAPAAALPARVRVVHRGVAMGGRLEIHVAPDAATAGAATSDAARAAARIRAWASPLSRHDPMSALSALNADPRRVVPLRPSLAAALAAAADAVALTDGIVDVTLLDERIAAEAGWSEGDASPRTALDRAARRGWRLEPGRRAGRWCVGRGRGVRFDLGGIGKGWLADRALALLDRHAGALVDADGDIAVRAPAGESWQIAVGDPRADGSALAVIELPGPGRSGELSGRFGLATSGTSIHRWGPPGSGRHHLIDPRTLRPAVTDVVQASVLDRTALAAEALAKAAVILGAARAVELVARAGAIGAVLLLDDGRAVATPGLDPYLR